ncbi:MAG: ribosome maturation factor RimP, partial [Bacillota bacterium]|nr:ribosome maturation factor RimP [Bacillota bacterium]
MAKLKITDIVERELADFLPENGYELFMSEYVKEGKDWYLRIYVDKPGGSISIEDCEKISGFIGKRLDELDPIEKNYFLEVSSPGLDRPLIKDSDYVKYKGEIMNMLRKTVCAMALGAVTLAPVMSTTVFAAPVAASEQQATA